jgi:hypothetical protein
MTSWNDPWKVPEAPDSFASGLAMGMLETKRRDLLRAIQLRFCSTVPNDLAATIRAMDDLDHLDRWLDVALTASGIDTFRAMTDWADSTAHQNRKKQNS